MKTKKNIWLIAILFGSTICSAQIELEPDYPRLVKFPVLSLDYFHHANSGFGIDSGQGEIQMNEFRAAIQFAPALKKDRTYLFNGLQYTYFDYKADFEVDALDSEKGFHAIEYTLGILHKLPNRWKLFASVSPMLSSDFEEALSSDDLLLQTTAIALKRSNPNFEYGFGLSYTTKFGNPLLLPVFRITYKKNGWTTLVSLPSYISQYYNLNDDTRIGVKAAVYGNAFNATFAEDYSEADVNRLIYTRVTMGPEFQMRILKDLYLNASSGVSLRNILEVQDSDLNTIGDFDIDNKFFFNLGLKILK